MDINLFIKVCNESSSMISASKTLNIPFRRFKRIAMELGCYNPNQNWSNGKTSYNDDRLKTKYQNDLFSQNSKARRDFVKSIIIKNNLIEYSCKECGISNVWNGKKISLQIDHVNGIRNDNRLENLRFLCPNCHSQTDTWCKKNKNTTNINFVNTNDIISTIIRCTSISSVIYNLGIVDTQSNRLKIKDIIEKNNLNLKDIELKKNLTLEKSKDIKNIRPKLICEICGQETKKKNICITCSKFKQRKVERPTHDQLLIDIKELGYSGTGRKYGVSDNSIRKWIKTN